ncbi:MAG: hypothetical protein KIS92_14280 [Planctomycetota bacterium]|nr:hypothetical protein [Planctomycetota bacterium]
MRMIEAVLPVLLLLGLAVPAFAADAPAPKWKYGPPTDETFFPITVWLQDPRNAAKYKAAGFNVYVALWNGPTEEHLTLIKEAGLKVICAQNEVGKKHLDDPTIIGWMHGDEPDNAQSLGKGKGYGPPILPSKIQEDYRKIREADPSRPVMLNLGQGVAWDAWHGRGTRTNKPEDYPEYMKGGDIVSFDIYPVTHSHKDVKDNLWFVPKGVRRLREWSKDEKTVWCCIECTHISSDVRPSVAQVRTEVWMALIAGAKGLIYFVHEWKPKFNEHALLDDPEMLEGVTKLNKQILALAPALNSPSEKDGVEVASSNAEAPVECVLKKHGGATYLFAVNMRGAETKATFTLKGASGKAEVLEENRAVEIKDGQLVDAFKPYEVHLYKIAP